MDRSSTVGPKLRLLTSAKWNGRSSLFKKRELVRNVDRKGPKREIEESLPRDRRKYEEL
jgi:hypothetical protein